jgi:hypothetical protein
MTSRAHLGKVKVSPPMGASRKVQAASTQSCTLPPHAAGTCGSESELEAILGMEVDRAIPCSSQCFLWTSEDGSWASVPDVALGIDHSIQCGSTGKCSAGQCCLQGLLLGLASLRSRCRSGCQHSMHAAGARQTGA